MADILDIDAGPASFEAPWDFEGAFTSAAAVRTETPPVVPQADDLAWLQALSNRHGDPGSIHASGRWIPVADWVDSLMNDMAADDDGARDAVAEFRDRCRRHQGWRSSDYDWPLLSD